MENEGRLHSQVAAEAHVSVEQAMTACYLSNLAKQGKTLAQAAELLRRDIRDVLVDARDWQIPFPCPSGSWPQPLKLTWEKEKRGRWILKHGDWQIAEADSNGSGGFVSSTRSGRQFTEKSTRMAIRRASEDIRESSEAILEVADVEIEMPVTCEGKAVLRRVAPKHVENPAVLARALAA